jgi:hypothetical protein
MIDFFGTIIDVIKHFFLSIIEGLGLILSGFELLIISTLTLIIVLYFLFSILIVIYTTIKTIYLKYYKNQLCFISETTWFCFLCVKLLSGIGAVVILPDGFIFSLIIAGLIFWLHTFQDENML